MADVQSFLVKPLTPEETDLVTNIALASFVVGLIGLLIFLGCSLYVAIRTKLPGRFLSLFSSTLLFVFFAFTHYMGGNLEYVYGPVGAIYSMSVYSVALALFSLGFLRMCLYLKRPANG